MKKLAVIIMMLLIAVGINNQAAAQSANLESTIKIDTSASQVLIQRLEFTTKQVVLKYDYKANDRDVIGLIFPTIWSDSTTSISGMAVKMGDGNRSDQYIADLWVNKQFGQFRAMLEVGRIVSFEAAPWDFAGTRLSYGNFTVEAYAMGYHPVTEKFNKSDSYFGWVAYHPKHAFVALGQQDNGLWAFAGTRNLKDFGSLSFLNYNKENGNFWFRSQSAFGEVNQNFYDLNTYIDATSYMVVPIFFYKHFSPIAAKGNLAVKVDGRRTNGVQNWELIGSKKIGNDWVRLAAGINSEFKDDKVRYAPSFELYKAFNKPYGKFIAEVRYDFLYNTFSAYLIVKY